MRRLFFLILMFCASLSVLAVQGVDSVLARLDKVIEQQNLYLNQKESCIDSLKRLLQTSPLSLQHRFALNKRLGKEYELFVSDSAMKYYDRSMSLADSLHNLSYKDEIRLHGFPNMVFKIARSKMNEFNQMKKEFLTSKYGDQ